MKLFVGLAKAMFPRMAYVTNVSLVDVCHVVGMVHLCRYWSLVCSSPTVVNFKQVKGITTLCLLTTSGFFAFPRFVSVTEYKC